MLRACASLSIHVRRGEGEANEAQGPTTHITTRVRACGPTCVKSPRLARCAPPRSCLSALRDRADRAAAHLDGAGRREGRSAVTSKILQGVCNAGARGKNLPTEIGFLPGSACIIIRYMTLVDSDELLCRFGPANAADDDDDDAPADRNAAPVRFVSSVEFECVAPRAAVWRDRARGFAHRRRCPAVLATAMPGTLVFEYVASIASASLTLLSGTVAARLSR